MSRVNVVGVDPGPTPGIVALQFIDRVFTHVDVVQCNAGFAPEALEAVLLMLDSDHIVTWVQIEEFVVRRRATRSSTASAGAETRNLIGVLERKAKGLGAVVAQRNASTVKPWATDERLEIAGLLEATKGMQHARDAARHALYAASREAAQPDPLSKEWRTA